MTANPFADLAQAPSPVRVPQIVIDQLNATVGEVGLEMVQAAEDAEFTGERVDLHDYQVSIPYDHAVAILAALEAPEAGVVELVEARAEAATLRDRLARMEGALNKDGDLIGTPLEMKLRADFRRVSKHHGSPLNGVAEADMVRAFLATIYAALKTTADGGSNG